MGVLTGLAACAAVGAAARLEGGQAAMVLFLGRFQSFMDIVGGLYTQGSDFSGANVCCKGTRVRTKEKLGVLRWGGKEGEREREK